MATCDDVRARGFAVAAAVHSDRGARLALIGLSPRLGSALGGIAVRLSEAPRSERQGFVRQVLLASTEVASEQRGRPPRALSLLATRVPRELGRAFLRDAPAPRPGYVPAPRLVALLRALAARASEEA